MCSLHPDDLNSELILSSLQLVLCHVVAVKSLPLHLYIFYSFWIIELFLSQFENRVPLKPVLGGVAEFSHRYINAPKQTQLNRVFYFRFLMCFLLPEDLHDDRKPYKLESLFRLKTAFVHVFLRIFGQLSS